MGVWAETFLAGIMPRDMLSGSEWADRYRAIAPGTSPQPGPWVTDRVPYLREILDSCTDRVTEEIVIMSSSQVGKSEILLNVMGYYADQEPSPILMLQPTVDLAKAFSTERIDETFKVSPGLKGKLVKSDYEERGNSRKPNDTKLLKTFPGGYLALVGTNATSGLASRPIRVILGDEVDRYPRTTPEGDPTALARQRTQNYLNRKVIWVSTPTRDGESKIQIFWNGSDQRFFEIPCPECGTFFAWMWEQVDYKTDSRGEVEPESVGHYCPHCHQKIRGKGAPDIDLMQKGEWNPTVDGKDLPRGYHINALYSPWVSLLSLCQQHALASRSVEHDALMPFTNLKLGIPFIEPKKLADPAVMQDRGESYGSDGIPDRVLLLTCGVDVQQRYLACEVVGWTHGAESWGVEYVTIYGNTSEDEVWNDLDELINRPRFTVGGEELKISATCIDSGYMAGQVYKFTNPREGQNVFAVKGSSNESLPFVNNMTRVPRSGAVLWSLGVGEGKMRVLSRAGLTEPGAGFCHYPEDQSFGYDEQYFRGLFSEERFTEYKGGQIKTGWKKVFPRNEPLDCRVYATAALEMLNPSFERLEKARQSDSYTAAKMRPRGRRVLNPGTFGSY